MMPSLRSNKILTIGIMILLVGGYIAVASHYVLHGDLNADEDFYCIASKRVMSGKILYRDFAYSQMPVVPYVNGLAMQLVGFGFLNQRAINVTWGALALIIAIILAYRTADWPGVIACACVFTLTINWVYFTCIGKTYALATFFLLVAAASLYREKNDLIKVTIFSIAGALALGCRLTVAPAVGVMWILLLIQAGTAKKLWRAIILPVAVMCCLYVPFVLASPENFWFWNIQYHAGTNLDRALQGVLRENFWLAPGLWTLILTALATMVVTRKKTPLRGVMLMLAGVIGIITQLALKSCYGENSIPFFGLAIVGAVEIIASTRFARWVLIPTVFVTILSLRGPQPKLYPHICKTIDNLAQFVQSQTHPTEKVLTTFPIIAIEANREVIPNCEMGKFCLTTEMDEDRARRLHLFTPKTLMQVVEAREPGAIVMTAKYTTWSFYWTVPSLQQADYETMRTVFRAMFNLYEAGMSDDFFLILIRKPTAP